MRNYKLSVIICTIGIILISLFVVYSTYAYFTVDVEGEGKDITLSTFDKNTTIIYNDTSNVSMVNAYTGDEIVKTFSVENTSNYILYYDILFNNVVNNFENKDDLIYKLESNNAAIRNTSIMPSENDYIASDVLLKPLEKHEYTMTITFVKKDTDQSKDMNKTFSSNIIVTGSKNINVGENVYKQNTLLDKIINDSEIEYTNNSINGKTTYYYKGNTTNNNVVYNNICFKIIRTDENYGIRLLYNGLYNDGTCSKEKYIDINKYNIKSDSNAYVGYMFGKASSNSYNNEHSNLNNSSNGVFCNNRQTNSYTKNGVFFSNKGYGKSNTGYYNLNSDLKSYNCINKNDRFSIDNNLTYPVGLISAEEIEFSGNNGFLYSNNYWTMTPAYFDGSNAYNYVVKDGKLTPYKVNNSNGIRPVIIIDKDSILESGDGSIESPFMIK